MVAVKADISYPRFHSDRDQMHLFIFWQLQIIIIRYQSNSAKRYLQNKIKHLPKQNTHTDEKTLKPKSVMMCVSRFSTSSCTHAGGTCTK